jgi:hypothetical protein
LRTTLWLPEIPIWDNRALYLPAVLAPGEYRLWVILYSFDSEGTLQRLPVSGGEVIEGTIGVLPTELTIASP